MPAAPATTTAQQEEVAKRYGIEAIPESVQRLNKLIAKQNGDLEDFTKLISQDKELSARLLRAANPRAETEDDYVCTTVEGALGRAGIGCAMLLAMTDPLSRAVLKAFKTMLNIPLETRRAGALEPIEGEHILTEVAFAGKATGHASLRLTHASANHAAASLLGMTPAEVTESGVLDDAIGELTNIVVGNFKSNLCDAGLNCKLSPPKITRTAAFKLEANGGLAERLAFIAPGVVLFVDIRVNPWGE